MDEYKVVFMHGFSQEEMSRIIRGVKSIVAEPGLVAFCMSTENNLEWKVRDLVDDVTKEHDYLKKHPPGGAPGAAPGGAPGAAPDGAPGAAPKGEK